MAWFLGEHLFAGSRIAVIIIRIIHPFALSSFEAAIAQRPGSYNDNTYCGYEHKDRYGIYHDDLFADLPKSLADSLIVTSSRTT